MISQFAEWSASFAETAPLASLQGTVIGIEAAEYLNRVHEFKIPKLEEPSGVLPEPLLPALGGVPFGLARVVRVHLASWRKYNITPIFVFSGLDIAKPDSNFAQSERKASKLNEAWHFYDQNDANAAVDSFRTSNAIKAVDLFRFLQTILRENGIQYMVAPYCAWAQLSYLQKSNVIDTAYGSSEIFLFDVPEVITSFDFVHDSMVWVVKRHCMNSLGNLSPDSFVDACILSGTDLLHGLPQLDTPALRKAPRLKSAADMVMNIGRGSGNNVCVHYEEGGNPRMQEYTQLFRKARLAVKHHVVISKNGKVELLDADNAPGNSVIHFIGQRLPDELYFYLSKGIIGPRVLNWRTTSQILDEPPLDGGDSAEYRTLIKNQLEQMRTSTLGLLAISLTFFYQHTEIKTRVWFDKEDIRGFKPDVRNEMEPLIQNWNVPQSVFGEAFNKCEGSALFGMCVKSLKDKEFAARTITKKNTSRLLTTKDELLANSIWRMLHIRGFIDDKHNLTAWGEVLLVMVSKLPANLEEMALIMVELARFDRLNSSESIRYTGVPEGNPETHKYMTLISRIACLGPLQHQEIGYTGVLSRNMLAYLSTIDAVRGGLRDLLEVCLTTLLLNGDADRERNDFSELGLDLPFILPLDCCLGVAVAYHLTECSKMTDPRSQASKDALLADERQKFYYAIDLPESFKTAWTLWDAVYEGIKAAPDSFKDLTAFESANEWLSQYR